VPDALFQLEGLMEHFLNEKTRREALHGFTHAGLHQLRRRFDVDLMKPQYSDGEYGGIWDRRDVPIYL
jgi:hypothetical protein